MKLDRMETLFCAKPPASSNGSRLKGKRVAMVILRYEQVLIYEYGCCDRRFSNLGGTQLLLWNAIQEAKDDQLSEFDMGRSDCGNPGLVLFKDRWGAKRTTLVYLRYPARGSRSISEVMQATVHYHKPDQMEKDYSTVDYPEGHFPSVQDGYGRGFLGSHRCSEFECGRQAFKSFKKCGALLP